jgi:small-conductance mechanosensitive channel
MIVPLLVAPTIEEVVALVATVSLALAFALKDYVSCMIAGVVTILENIYQPGDWIEVDGTYGEVTAIGTRAVHIVTADDTEVIVPHSKLWSSSVFNIRVRARTCLSRYRLFDPLIRQFRLQVRGAAPKTVFVRTHCDPPSDLCVDDCRALVP